MQTQACFLNSTGDVFKRPDVRIAQPLPPWLAARLQPAPSLGLHALAAPCHCCQQNFLLSAESSAVSRSFSCQQQLLVLPLPLLLPAAAAAAACCYRCSRCCCAREVATLSVAAPRLALQGTAEVTGSPTEQAILTFGTQMADFHVVKSTVEILKVQPFNSESKRMGVVVREKQTGARPSRPHSSARCPAVPCSRLHAWLRLA